jgi:ABC-2 type transport system ATP-binding protein
MKMSDYALQLQNLAKSFDGKPVLRNISVGVEQGEVIGLLGLNGAGKTTLLETSLGFCIPDDGSSAIFGQDGIEMDKATRARIGFVPQRDELLDGIKGKAWLDLVARFYDDWDHDLIDRLAVEWDVPLDTRTNKMSVGQRQKLSIISALGHHPDLIILDEPVASLDPLARRRFLKELVDIASSQTRTILFSTHIVSDLERVASRVWMMQDGAITVDADMDQLKEQFVRIRFSHQANLPTDIEAKHLLSSRSDSIETIALYRNWQPRMSIALQSEFGEAVQIESLALEELFLELHA